MSTQQKDSYKQIFKATSIFGGTQVVSILISIIRSKFVAVFLGPTGMGTVGLLTSTTDLIGGVTNFGLRTSAVKKIAHAHANADEIALAKHVLVLRRLVWLTGLLGVSLTFVLAPWLSQFTFGNKSYTTAIRWISIILLLNQIVSGQGVVLQAMRQLKYSSLSSIYGSVAGLFIVIPIYYYWGMQGIVPVLIITSLVSLLLTGYFARKTKLVKVTVSYSETWQLGKEMLKLGFILSMSGLMTTAVSYLLRIFISNHGSVNDVGLYSAGFAIVGTYVGMIFTAMSTDYYPRLAGVSHDVLKTNQLVNQQGEVALLILGPVLAFFIIFNGWVVHLLYSSKFIKVMPMLAWAGLGMYFKTATWTMGFIFLAKSDSKAFFWNELSVNVYGFLLNISGYYFFGLEGLGISFFLMFFLYFLQVYWVTRKKYAFSFDTKFITILGVQIGLGVICFIISKYLKSPYSYILGLFPVFASIVVSYKALDSMFGIHERFKRFRKNDRE